MIKMRNFLPYIMIIFGTISSVFAKGFFSNSYKVTFDKTLEQVRVRAELMDKEKTYQKPFIAKDKMGNVHTVTIYDDEYMKIDNVFYAYKFRNLIWRCMDTSRAKCHTIAQKQMYGQNKKYKSS